MKMLWPGSQEAKPVFPPGAMAQYQQHGVLYGFINQSCRE